MAFSRKKSEENSSSAQEKLSPMKKFFLDFKDYLYIFVAFMLAFVFLFRVVQVEGASMNRTLFDGDRLILVSRVLYRTPKQGDIIVASKTAFDDGKRIIKRVIATQGQTVDIDFDNRIVYVDGVALSESYVYFSPTDDRPMIQEGVQFPVTVPEGCVFVMGDNRNNSKDSRSTQIGMIDEREILGKVVFLLFPGSNKGEVGLDLSRIGVVH